MSNEPQPQPLVHAQDPRSTWRRRDVAGTVTLLVALLAATGVASSLGLLISMTTAACGPCATGMIWAGVAIGAVGPLLVLAGAVSMAVVRLRRHRVAWWVPLVCMPALPVPVLIGAAVAQEAIGR